MTRLPVPGSDDGTWGVLLNEFLSNSHDSTGMLKDGVVTNAKLSTDAVGTTNIQTGAVSEAKLDNAVQTKLNTVASGSPDATTTTNGLVRLAGDLTGTAAAPAVAAAAITNTKLADGAVTNAKLSTDAVGTTNIQTGAVSEAKLDNAVQTKLNTVASGSPDATTTTNGLVRLAGDLTGTAAAPAVAAAAITNTKLADGAVTNTKLADASVNAAKLITSLAPTSGQLMSYNGTSLVWSDPGSIAPGTNTVGVLTVASSESPQAVKDASDYVCTGVDDQTIINQALLRASRAGDGFGGEGYIGVQLVGPTFFVGNNGTTSITMYPSTHLFGNGQGTLIRPMWPSNLDRGAIELLNTATAHVRVSNLSIGRTTAVNFNGSGIKFIGTGQGDQYEIKTANDPYCVIDHVNVLFANRKGIYITGTSGGLRETQISHCVLWNSEEEGILVSGSSDCQISDCRANGGGSFPRFSLSGGNTKIANCKAYYSGSSSSLNADGFQVSSSRCEVVGCSAQDNGRYGYNISSGSANISACTADSNSRLQSDGGGFLITNDCSAQGLVAFDRGQTPGSPQTRGIVFSGVPQVNVTGYVDVPSGTNQVVGTVSTDSFVRIVRKGTTTYTTG